MKQKDELKSAILACVDNLADELWEVSGFLYEHPELGLEEFQAVAKLSDILTKYDFEVNCGIAELPTAFKAVKRGKSEVPTIAYLAEYDALPEVGHGCGHNLIAVAGVYAGIALGTVIKDLPGSVIVMGTPAEESIGGKIKMLEKGAFDDVAVALMTHPSTETVVRAKALAAHLTEIKFRGRPAHAAAAPWRGINALDALIQTFVGLDQLRKQLKPTVRIAGIITEGGKRANVVPEQAVGLFSVRAETYNELQDLLEKVNRIAQGAALATGASVEISHPEPLYLDMRNVEALAKTFENCWLEIGGTLYKDPDKTPGSLDIGNVSYKLPALHPSYRITDKPLAGHSREFAEATRTPMARQETIRVIKALALTGLELLTKPGLLQQILTEFRQMQEAVNRNNA